MTCGPLLASNNIVGKTSSLLLAVLLAGTVFLGRCVSCRSLAAQEPAHNCCHTDRCHRPSEDPRDHRPCPNQALALEHYDKVELDPTAVPAPAGQSEEALAPASPRVTRVAASAESLVAHSPPDLYLRNSALLI